MSNVRVSPFSFGFSKKKITFDMCDVGTSHLYNFFFLFWSSIFQTGSKLNRCGMWLSGSQVELDSQCHRPELGEIKREPNRPSSVSASFQQLGRMSDWPKLASACSPTPWSDSETAPSSGQRRSRRRLCMIAGGRINLSLDSPPRRYSPESQSALTRFIFPSHQHSNNKNIQKNSAFHQSDPGGL